MIPSPPAQSLPLRSRPVNLSESNTPRRLGDFQITGFIGRGGMGMVLRAEDSQGRQAAIKTLLQGRSSEHARKRFTREGEMLALLDHPGIVKLLGEGRDEGVDWIALELIEGGDLEGRLAEGPPEPEEIRSIALQVALALAHAHERGVLHRDVKPANLLLERETGRVVVTDFGVGRDLERSRMTKTGAMVGTITCMAPEQLRGDSQQGPPADVWGIGALIYRCLTNRSPVPQEDYGAIAKWLKAGRVTPPDSPRAKADRALIRICMRCLAWDPEDRLEADEVAELLGQKGEPPRVRPLATMLGLLVLFALGLGLRLAWSLGGPPLSPSPTPEVVVESPTPKSPWKTKWALPSVGEPELELERPSLWRESGRVAAALRGAEGGQPEALAEAFAGEAEALGGGRVQVRYEKLEEACLLEAQRIGTLISSLDTPAGLLPGQETLRVPDNVGYIYLRFGAARWKAVHFSCEARGVPGPDVDMGWTVWTLGSGPSRLVLDIHERRKRSVVSAQGQNAIRTYALPTTWTSIRLAPGARPGERVVLDGKTWSKADEVATGATTAGPVSMIVAEQVLGLRRVVISGVPLRADRAALAWIPGAHSAPLRVRATFAGEGTTLVLRSPTHSYSLEVGGGRLEFRRGRELLRAVPLSEELSSQPLASQTPGVATGQISGTLWLEHRAGHLRGGLRTAAGEVFLETWEWRLASVPELRAGYGGSGRESRFASVELALDAPVTLADGAADWRRGGEVLESVAQLTRRDLSLSGRAMVAPRAEVARRAAESLGRAAAGLEGGARADARAREVWAWVVAGDAVRSQEAMAALIEEQGQVGARQAAAWLLTYEEEPRFLQGLSEGYSLVETPVRVAATRAYLKLKPTPESTEAYAKALALLGEMLAQQGEVDEGLELLQRACALSLSARFPARRARVLLDVKRSAEALELLRAIPPLLRNAYAWRTLLQAEGAEGQVEGALEAACGLVARERSLNGRQTLENLLGKVLERAEPSLVAASALVLSRAAPEEDPRLRGIWLKRATDTARRVSPDAPERSRDLVRYVLLCSTEMPDRVVTHEESATRPTAILVRARGGDPKARAQLRAAATADGLVYALTRLDPDLAEFLKKRP